MTEKFSTLITNSLVAFATLLTLFPSIALFADILSGNITENIFSNDI